MTKMLLAVIGLMFAPMTVSSQDIVAIATLGTPVPQHAGRRVGWDGHVEYVQWAGDSVVCGGRSGFLRYYDPKTKRRMWSAQMQGEIDSLAVASGKDRLYVLTKSQDLLGDSVIHELRLSDGKKSRKLKIDHPNRIAWFPLAEQLVVTTFSDKYGENGVLFDSRTLKKAATMKCDGFVTEITPVGRFIVTLSHQNNIRIWDTKTCKEIFKNGNDEQAPIDAPFTSNAMFDGERTLVYTVDNSWATGKVVVHDILADKETASFDSRNGHVVIDVDFAHGQIALTGTSRNLTVVDLSGRVIADKEAVALQRNVSVDFAPDGKQLAIGSWDNTVRVLELSGN